MHRIYLFIIGLGILATAFVGLWPAAIYAAQQFNTNLVIAIFGAFLTAAAFFPGKNGS